MRRATGAIGGVLAALMGGCEAPAQVVDEPTAVVQLPGLALQIEVARDAEVTALRGGHVGVMLRPRSRRPLWIGIWRAVDPPEPGLELREGALAYRLTTTDAGMGGEQMQLIGRVDVGGVVYEVRCTEESEERMTLDWCFAALRTLQAQR